MTCLERLDSKLNPGRLEIIDCLVLSYLINKQPPAPAFSSNQASENDIEIKVK